MLKRLFFIIALTGASIIAGLAQNANKSTTTRQRTSTTTTKSPAKGVEEAGTPQTEPTPKPTPRTAGSRTGGRTTEPTAKDVLATFNSLLEGIRHADVNAVTGVYWNSPQLVLFNNNGTVTKGWQQMRTNRESSYPNLKDVKLDARDVHVQMLGRDGAVVTFLWSQSQTYNGTPDSATGRTTLVFRRIGTAWKIVHAHTSTDAPDQSRVPTSERTTPMPKATPTPQ
jgi:ketosteroid isomerase-like protein